MAIIGIITKASVSSLESSCFSKYSGAPQGHHVLFHAKGPPLPPPPYISLLYIIYHISLLHPRWDEQCRDTMMTVPPQLTSSLPSFSCPASFHHPPPASSAQSTPFSDVEKMHAVVARSTFLSQKCKKTDGFGALLDVQMSFCVAGARDYAPCQKWARREGFVAVSPPTTTTVHSTPLHSTMLHYTTTATAATTTTAITLRYKLHYTTLH